MKSCQIIVLGALGRMGRAILDAMVTDPSFTLKGAVVREKSIQEGKTLGQHGVRSWGEVPLNSSPKEVGKNGDVVVDVTRAEGVHQNVEWAEASGLPYVLAVTGLDDRTLQRVHEASKKIPIVVAPNLSLGVAVLHEIASIAAELLPQSEIEIVESHHREKRDAPSGTALSLSRTIAERSRRPEEPNIGFLPPMEKEKGSITIHSIRGGDIVGDHEIHLMLQGEKIILHHQASSRAIFARGALQAARFVVGQKPGVYSMRDVLGLGVHR